MSTTSVVHPTFDPCFDTFSSGPPSPLGANARRDESAARAAQLAVESISALLPEVAASATGQLDGGVENTVRAAPGQSAASFLEASILKVSREQLNNRKPTPLHVRFLLLCSSTVRQHPLNSVLP